MGFCGRLASCFIFHYFILLYLFILSTHILHHTGVVAAAAMAENDGAA